MDVQSYIFQSPSPQRVQVGRPDSSTVKEETDTKSETDESFKPQEQEVQTQDLKIQETDALTLKNANQILDLYV